MQKRIVQNIERITNFVFISFCTMVFGTALLCAVTLFADPEDATENFPYHAYFPEFVSMELKLMTMSGATAWDALMVVVHDSLIMALMNHICAQLMILKVTLQDLTESNYKTRPLKQLKECVVHHQMIIHLRNEVEGVFSYMLLLQFLASLFIFGLTGFQATVGSYRQYNVYAYCCCVLSELFIYCWFSNQVIDQVTRVGHRFVIGMQSSLFRMTLNYLWFFFLQSNSLGYKAYSSSWQVFGRDYSRILQMIICKSITPIQLTGGGFFIISLDTFSSVNA